MNAYHGTDEANVPAILREGLLASKASGNCPHIWLAVRAKDAAWFGTVLVVDMNGLDFDWMDRDEPDYQPFWQGCYHGGDIAPGRISLVQRL